LQLGVEAAPQLKACVVYQFSKSRIIIEQGDSAFSIDFDQGEAAAFMAVHAMLDGKSSLRAIHAATDIPLQDLEQVVASLDAAGLLTEDYAQPTIEADYFVERLIAACRMWRRHMLCHELFERLKAPGAPRSLLEALLVEAYFYVRYSERAIAAASANARPPLTPVIAALAVDESGHDAHILGCLEAMGWTAARLASCQPGIATEAVGLLLRTVAAEDPFAFLALLSISEAAPDEIEPGRAYLSELEQCHRLPAGALDGLRNHLLLDASGGHFRAVRRAAGLLGHLEVGRADAILNSAHRFKHFLDNMHDGILAVGMSPSDARSGSLLSLRQIL
jgi:hypothetical protein